MATAKIRSSPSTAGSTEEIRKQANMDMLESLEKLRDDRLLNSDGKTRKAARTVAEKDLKSAWDEVQLDPGRPSTWADDVYVGISLLMSKKFEACQAEGRRLRRKVAANDFGLTESMLRDLADHRVRLTLIKELLAESIDLRERTDSRRRRPRHVQAAD